MTGGWIDLHHHLLPPPLLEELGDAAVTEVAGRALAELVGWEHVVFGSDFPFAPELAAQLSVMSLCSDQRFDAGPLEGIKHANALRLLDGDP